MPNVTQMIKSVTQEKKVQQEIVEKDYALSYLLVAINSVEKFNKNLVLKGGTALKKLYFPTYRFSEDLDYSTRVLGPIEQIETHMETVVARLGELLMERGPFQVSFEPLILKEPHPGDQKAYIFRVQFPEQRKPLCRLKVEITVDELILLPTETRLILHGFTEKFTAGIPVYSLMEVTSEKLRALLQSKVRLQDRGWGASRVCRDYYDLWNLLQLPEIERGTLIRLLKKKCEVRSVSFSSPRDFISEDLLNVARSEWPQQLLPFVPDAPPVNELLTKVQSLILSVWE